MAILKLFTLRGVGTVMTDRDAHKNSEDHKIIVIGFAKAL
jgi:hypothetical protein